MYNPAPPLTIIAITSILATWILGYLAIRAGWRLNLVGRDMHKPWESYASSLGGLALVAVPVIPFIVVQNTYTLGFMLVSFIGLAVGLLDDFKTLPARRKVLLSTLPALPVVLLGIYDPRPEVLFLGSVRLTIIYPLIVIAAFAVALNSSNMIDTHNGLLAGVYLVVFTTLTPLLIARSIDTYSYTLIHIATLGGVLGFLIHNMYPAKLFVGNSGAFMIGSWIAFLTFLSRSEFLIILSMLPLVVNGYTIVLSIGGLKERREIRERPVIVSNGVIEANKNRKAPITLVHIATLNNRLREPELVASIWIMLYISAVVASLIWLLAG